MWLQHRLQVPGCANRLRSGSVLSDEANHGSLEQLSLVAKVRTASG